jgi:hypothetical protein
VFLFRRTGLCPSGSRRPKTWAADTYIRSNFGAVDVSQWCCKKKLEPEREKNMIEEVNCSVVSTPLYIVGD